MNFSNVTNFKEFKRDVLDNWQEHIDPRSKIYWNGINVKSLIRLLECGVNPMTYDQDKKVLKCVDLVDNSITVTISAEPDVSIYDAINAWIIDDGPTGGATHNAKYLKYLASKNNPMHQDKVIDLNELKKDNTDKNQKKTIKPSRKINPEDSNNIPINTKNSEVFNKIDNLIDRIDKDNEDHRNMLNIDSTNIKDRSNKNNKTAHVNKNPISVDASFSNATAEDNKRKYYNITFKTVDANGQTIIRYGLAHNFGVGFMLVSETHFVLPENVISIVQVDESLYPMIDMITSVYNGIPEMPEEEEQYDCDGCCDQCPMADRINEYNDIEDEEPDEIEEDEEFDDDTEDDEEFDFNRPFNTFFESQFNALHSFLFNPPKQQPKQHRKGRKEKK